ncbi:MAG: Coenzyme F420 hydrogenase/dehydrogenase, beta subunit C-terminal domain [bacterium]
MGMLKVKAKNPSQALRELFAGWLEGGRLSAMLVPVMAKSGAATLALVSDPAKLADAAPLLPAMAVNAASVVHDIAKQAGDAGKVGLLLRPCELRAVVELIKLRQVDAEAVVLVGIDCPGTYKAAGFRETRTEGEEFDNDHIRRQRDYYDSPNLRTACQVCEFSSPPAFDVAIGFLGLNPDKELWLEAATDKGRALLEGVETAGEEPAARREYLKELAGRRLKKAAARIEELDKAMMGPEKLVSYFADCINCHNCMRVCPVCYCHECFFDSDTFKRGLDEHVRTAKRKGLTRMPSETLLFHLTRMNHMMASCVACGICEDSCPAGVGLLSLFRKVSRNVQAEFDYVSGRSLEEPLPLVAFREDEFQAVGESE